ncbi:MAG: Crp/Fnr family transcriptional regulator [Acidimicrobiia bacterium]
MKANDAAAHFLKSVPCFADVNSRTLATLSMRCRPRRLAARQLLFVEGDPCQDLHILVDGHVNTYRASAEGREQIVRVFDRPGNTFCIPAVFTVGRNIVTARTMAETSLYLIDRATVVDVVRKNPSVALKLVIAVGDETKKAIDLVESLSLKPTKVRLAKFLYERALAEGACRGKGIRLTRDRLREEDVASTVGTVRVHVSRSLQSLARAGAIVLERGAIHIPDLMALGRAVEETHHLSD